MRNFKCRHCGKRVIDISNGELHACEHFPIDMAKSVMEIAESENAKFPEGFIDFVKMMVKEAK